MSLPDDIYDFTCSSQPWTAKCVCGKRFTQPNSYGFHVGFCLKFKNRLGLRLSAAKQKRRDELVPQNAVASSSGSTGSISHPQSSSGNAWSKKRKPSWIDDDNLDVDLVVSHPSEEDGAAAPSSLPQTPQPSNLPNSLANDDSEETYDGHSELGKGHRKKQLSYKVRPNTNFLPSSTLPASLYPSDALLHLPKPPERRLAPIAEADEATTEEVAPTMKIRTPINTFGLYKVFDLTGSADRPHDPDNSILPEDLRENTLLSLEKPPAHSGPEAAQVQNTKFYPFPNASSYLLGEWYWSDDREKSQRSFHDLLDIVGSEDFRPADVRDANWKAIDRVLAGSAYDVDDLDSRDWVDDGISWKTTSLTIEVPFSKLTKNPGNHAFTVEGFHYRPLVSVIREKLESSSGREYFHTMGYELRWNPGQGKEHVRVHGELYTSPAFLEAYEELQTSPPEPGCDLPRHVVGLMFASDSTMLAAFGTAKLWPLYMLYGNDSKYRRSKPTEKLFETVAYFEKLPDSFKDFLIKMSGKSTINKALLTHCQREMFHKQWHCLLDDEEDLLASIKNLGLFPCPRCYVAMADVPAMGKKRDRTNRTRLARVDNAAKRSRVSKARALVYADHHPVTSKLLEGHLAYGSLVPTDNAFSTKLSGQGFNLYDMLVVDVMHEVEIGGWKAVFIQLLRLLEACNKGALNQLDERYRSMPTFRKDTIRRFSNNVTEMKQLAARDWEDLLQCSLAAFEGLLPAPHDKRVMKLLFIFTKWHGLAKLRLHTDHTLSVLDDLTTELGDQMRHFVDHTCSQFDTKELNREYQARKRREAKTKGAKNSLQPTKSKGKQAAEGKGSNDGDQVASKRPAKRQKTGDDASSLVDAETDDTTARKEKTLNLNTYKFHSFGDVVHTIRRFGTTDSYSTQIPELLHRIPKAHYKRTSKKNVSRQLSRIQMRQARIRKLRKQLLPDVDEGYQDDGAHMLPYFIGKSQNSPVNLPSFCATHRGDPAAKDFLLRLKRHLLPRIYRCLLDEARAATTEGTDATRAHFLETLLDASTNDPEFLNTPDACSDVDQIFFHSDRIFEHNVLNINYTSYDVRRETDVVNPKTSRRDVMCLREIDGDASEDSGVATSHCTPAPPPHRFVHARVLKIFHANVIYRGRGSMDLRRRRFDFLFVRWFKYQTDSPADYSLDRMALTPMSSPDAVGFLDPMNVLRASHIIPRYALGLKNPGCGESDRQYPPKHGSSPIVSKLSRDWDDWREYYVNRFVDRDMLMRYMWGHGVGHAYCHADAPPASVLPCDPSDDGNGQPGQTDDPSDPDDLEPYQTADCEHDDTLEDLEGQEIDIQCDSEEEGSEEDREIQDPEDEDDDRW